MLEHILQSIPDLESAITLKNQLANIKNRLSSNAKNSTPQNII